MTTYFDIIPEELISIILFNIEEVSDHINLKDITAFNKVLMTQEYWIQKIKITLPRLDLKCIPQSLLNFKNDIFDITLMNYGSILRAYNYMKEIISQPAKSVKKRKDRELHEGDQGEEVRYDWAWDLGINNFKLLRLDLLNNEDILEITSIFTIIYPYYYKRHIEDHEIKISFYDTGRYKFTITGMSRDITYFISRQDVINMIIHLACNRSQEVKSF